VYVEGVTSHRRSPPSPKSPNPPKPTTATAMRAAPTAPAASADHRRVARRVHLLAEHLLLHLQVVVDRDTMSVVAEQSVRQIAPSITTRWRSGRRRPSTARPARRGTWSTTAPRPRAPGAPTSPLYTLSRLMLCVWTPPGSLCTAGRCAWNDKQEKL